ncbi:hypothetical protein [Catenulispora pinisilvae]|uniref:hypothetical protein n=1 Tax=Catenulispora pinisilvae TaxID=2705253 RepID=UPI00189221FB|nr:hypothetical protein [Catenulispora pinisilvae]
MSTVPDDDNDDLLYPTPSTAEWQARFVDAVLATPGVNVPRGALEAIAPFVVNPKTLIARSSTSDQPQLRPSAYRPVSTDAGKMIVAVVPMAGWAGVPWERNERQSTAWSSAADPGAQDAQWLLPPLSPWTSEAGDAGAALRVTVPTFQRMVEILDRAGNELELREGRRGYDLVEDLALNGQIEPCLHVAQQYCLQEPNAVGDQRTEYWAWPAVRGNNRTRARHQLLEISPAEVLVGISSSKIGRGGSDIYTNPTFWLRELSKLWNRRLQAAIESEDFDAPAYRARRVAVVETHLVIGSPTPERLYHVVQTSNRRDHAHPPLDFTPNDRARSLGRTILSAYVARGILDPATADVLTGDRPVTELPGVAADATVSVLRDARSMRLLQELFPTDASEQDKARRRILRTVLSEPPPSQLTRNNVNQRLRAWSALTSVSYPEPWNPRVADILPVNSARSGIELSGRSLGDLLESAPEDAAAFDELLYYRAPHWLAAFDIVDADRGSMGAQNIRRDSQDADDEVVYKRLRRSVDNAIRAMRADPVRAVGLLREIAAAMDEGRAPRRIDDDGEPEEYEDEAGTYGRADQPWFDFTFPKVAAARGPIALPAMANAPLPETDSQAVERLLRELNQVIESLQEGVKLVPELAAEARVHARAAGIACPLPDAEADRLVATLARITADMRELPEVIIALSRNER